MTATISAKDVASLRNATGAGMMDCKEALRESNGDYEGALEWLRKKGQKVAAKRADRDAKEGVVIALTNSNATKGLLLALSSETDFVAKNDEFIAFATKLANMGLEKSIQTRDELLALPFEGSTVAEALVGLTGKIGEKIEVSDYQILSGEKITSYVHAGSKIGVIVSYKDGGKADAGTFFRQIAMHIAAMNPIGMSPDEFDPAFVAKETEAIQSQIKAENEKNQAENLGKPMKNVPRFVSRLQLTPEVMKEVEDSIKAELKAEGKPEKIWDKIVPGKIERFIADNTLLDQERCLMSQFFVVDVTKTVAASVKAFSPEAEILGFKRVAVG